MTVFIHHLDLQEKVDYLLTHHQDFKRFKIVKNATIRGIHDKEYFYDYILVNKEEFHTIGILIKDWKRSCGYQNILRAEKSLKGSGLSKIMVISNTFSEVARTWAKKLNIITLSDGEIGSILISKFDIEVIEP
ncbi:MAG: restriction endonuclease [Candidatus Hodarchaeales archaeon]|jgi:hypothetical protein